MQDNLPVIDYSRHHETQTPDRALPDRGDRLDRSPRPGRVKGPAAKKIIRKGALRDAPT